jgi:hypothetical protein
MSHAFAFRIVVLCPSLVIATALCGAFTYITE